jgi:diguanylate cyclase (GGDEF)-like protein
VKSAVTLPEESRQQVRRIVLISRVAGLIVVLALGAMVVVINWGQMYTAEGVAGMLTVAVGGIAFFALSTLARVGHTRVIENTLSEVQRLTEQLREMADTDALTGLWNLRAFQSRLEAEIGYAARDGRSISLIIGDLDNFKLINDAYGHQFGDQVLAETGKVFASVGGPMACAARLGGDEFAVILPDRARKDALDVAHRIDAALRDLRLNAEMPATLGSFGIGTYPDDGASVRELFAAADSRMYSEKHRRKAESVSSLTGAARKLFVRIGRAMRPDHTTAQILQQIATAARDEFALSLCTISIGGGERHSPLVVAAGSLPEYERACIDASGGEPVTASTVAECLAGETWVLDAPIPDENGTSGVLVLAGQPSSSFRPDALIVMALADLVQAVVANGRAHVDAIRAGRERDIHIDLARELATAGSLQEGLTVVTRMIAEFVGCTSVLIEGLSRHDADVPFHVSFGRGGEVLRRWEEDRVSEGAQAFLRRIAEEGPSIMADPLNDTRIPDAQRELLSFSGMQSVAVSPVRFDGQPLAVVAGLSTDASFFDEGKLALLTTIADHLAPAIKVGLLRDELEASYQQLEQASRESLARLADAAEARDPHTGGHLRRIRHYSVELARELGLSEDEANAIGAASAIHDLGKLRLPDTVLMNPGKLSEDDWELIRLHPEHGERLIGDSPMFETERIVVRWHHERWDGSGYPDGLRGEQIPLPARIVAVADALDALTTERPYKRAWSLQEAYDEIERMKDKLFCPRVVDALAALASSGRLVAIFEAVEDHEQTHRAMLERDAA